MAIALAKLEAIAFIVLDWKGHQDQLIQDLDQLDPDQANPSPRELELVVA